MSDAERQALATLSDGLEEALAGLGQSESPTMDLAGLMNYDRSVFSGLSLALDKPIGPAVLRISGLVTQPNMQQQAVFDMAMLQALPQHSFTTQTPWYAEPVKFYAMCWPPPGLKARVLPRLP